MGAFVLAFLGIVASSVSLYIAASFTLAQKQLLAATRLQAYLLHYGRLILDWNMSSIALLGQEWDTEEQAIFQRDGSAEELVNLSNEKKKLCDQIAQATKNPDLVSSAMYSPLAEMIRNLTTRDAEALRDALKVGRQNILSGLTFITDEEASHLGTYVATHAIALKTGIIELMDGVTFHVARAVEAKSSEGSEDTRRLMEQLIKLLWRGLVVSRDHSKLLRESQRFTNSSVVALTWRNIRQGSRITRR